MTIRYLDVYGFEMSELEGKEPAEQRALLVEKGSLAVAVKTFNALSEHPDRIISIETLQRTVEPQAIDVYGVRAWLKV